MNAQRAEKQQTVARPQSIQSSAGTATLIDNRPAAAAQRRLAAAMAASPSVRQLQGLAQMMDNSPRVLQQKALADSIGNSPRVAAQRRRLTSLSSGAAVQRAAEDEELLQGKFAPVQRAAEDEELLQGKFAPVQRAAEDEELLQGKFAPVQRAAEDEELLQGKFAPVQRQKTEPRPNRTGLPDNLKSGIETLSGLSMDNVRVHYNSSQPSQLNALAYAQGSDIHVGPGQEQHLPHEAWHLVQQAQGRVKPTMQLREGVPVNDDAGLEKEADVMGAKALQMALTQ